MPIVVDSAQNSVAVATSTLKVNDTSPPLTASLEHSNGGPEDLAGATVQFVMGLLGRDPVVDGAAVVVDAGKGRVRYNWVAGDTGTAGTYLAEFRVTRNDGSRESFPNDGYIRIVVLEGL